MKVLERIEKPEIFLIVSLFLTLLISPLVFFVTQDIYGKTIRPTLIAYIIAILVINISIYIVLKSKKSLDKVKFDAKENQKYLRAITDSAQDCIVIMDQNGDVSYWNPSSEKVFGFSANEVIGKNLHQMISSEKSCNLHEKTFDRFQKTGRGGHLSVQ